MLSSLSIKQMFPNSWVRTAGCMLIILSWYAAEAGAVLHCSMSALRLPALLSACLQAEAAQHSCWRGARGSRWQRPLRFPFRMWEKGWGRDLSAGDTECAWRGTGSLFCASGVVLLLSSCCCEIFSYIWRWCCHTWLPRLLRVNVVASPIVLSTT